VSATRPIRQVPKPSPWARHAAAVLQAARLGDQAATVAAAKALLAAHGSGVIPQVMVAWIDTLIGARGITEVGQPARIMFADTDTGAIGDVTQVRPEVAWAGRLINARIADDEESFRALMGAVPEGKSDRYVTTLLDCCAQSINLAIGRPR